MQPPASNLKHNIVPGALVSFKPKFDIFRTAGLLSVRKYTVLETPLRDPPITDDEHEGSTAHSILERDRVTFLQHGTVLLQGTATILKQRFTTFPVAVLLYSSKRYGEEPHL